MPAVSPGRLTAALSACAVVGASLLASTPAYAASTSIVISEAYGGGGNAGATLKNDFVELYNLSGAAQDLAGWSVRYSATSGNVGGTCTLSKSIAAGGHYLIQLAAGSGGSADLPTPDATCTTPNLSGTGGSVELHDAAGTVIDLLGYGTSTNPAFRFETAPAPATTNATSSARKDPAVDTDNNSADFATGAPTPTNSGGGGGTDPEPPEPTEVAIAAIQGTGVSTPLSGQTVTTVGVVTANYPTGGFGGFYLQTPGTGGSNPKPAPGASDGIFVYGTTDVQIGGCYTVTGMATEFNGLTQLTRASAQAPLVITPKADCAAVQPTLLATLPVTDADKEQYEGMLVQPQGTYTITNNYQLNQYGQLGLAVGDQPLYQATDVVAPGAAAAAYEAENLAKYITLDDGSSWDYLRNATAQASPLPYLSQETPMRTGAHVTFAQPVILDYRFQWNYQPTGQVVGATSPASPASPANPLSSQNDRPTSTPAVGGNISLGFMNVLNYFTDLGVQENTVKTCNSYNDRFGNPVATNFCEVRGAWTQSAFEDQQAKIVSAINAMGSAGAAVVGLSEIENSAAVSWIQHDRDASLRQLVTALNAAGGTWAYVPSPVVTPPNEDIIRTAFIYNPTLVKPKDAPLILIDPAFANARQPLAQEWKYITGPTSFVTVVNHFKSKGSGEDDGTGQGLSNPSRVAQAQALTVWTNATWQAKDPVFLLGDFNAYSQEDPVKAIEAAGYGELVKQHQPNSASYQFSGRLGTLDHVFGNAAAAAMVTGAGVWDINGDESIAMQYSRRHYNVVDFHTTSAFASSDHDPVLVGLKVQVPPGQAKKK